MQTRVLMVLPLIKGHQFRVFFSADNEENMSAYSRVPGMASYGSREEALEAFKLEYKAPNADLVGDRIFTNFNTEGMGKNRGGIMDHVVKCGSCEYTTNMIGDLTAHRKAHHPKARR
jgi:hypothetical protein